MVNSLEMFKKLTDEGKNIFSLVQKNGPLTKNNLIHLSNMKLTTLNRTMEPLEELQLITEYSIGQSTGGRKPVLYDIWDNRYYIIGIDISRTYTQVVITNLKIQILYKHQFHMESSHSPENTIDTIKSTIIAGLKELHIDSKQVLGIGVGTVGPLDRARGVMLNPINFESSGWVDIPLKDILQQQTGYPVVIDNGANAAVLAENLFGLGRNLKNVVYLNCGMGIRTGAISSGHLVRTINNAEDAFGHMVIDVDGEACSCGNFGCVECYASIYAITKNFICEIKKGRPSEVSLPIEDIHYLDICHAAENGDFLAKEVITGAAAVLGIGLANFINLLNPQMMILSGPLVQHSKLFYQTCTDVAKKKCYMNKEGNTIFARGGYFEENAIAAGSAAMFLEACLNDTVLCE